MNSTVEIAEMAKREGVSVPVWDYQNDDVVLVPYVDGAPSKVFSNEFLFFLYSRCKQDKLLDLLFPGMDTITPAKFVSYLKDRTVLVGLVKPNYEVAGFAFIYEVEGGDGARKGTIGFTFFKKFWGTSKIQDISRFALSWWFKEAKFNIIFGTTLVRNKVAVRFAKNLGFNSVGRVPMFFSKNGILEDMFLMYVTPDTFIWKKKYPENHSGRSRRN